MRAALRQPLAAIAAILLAHAFSPLAAQEDQQPHGVRGTLQAVSENGLVVQTRTGEVLGFALKDGAGISSPPRPTSGTSGRATTSA